MLLSREIIKRIFLDVGVVPGADFGKFGLTTQNYQLDTKFLINYDDETQAAMPLWAGQAALPGCKVRALLLDLSYPEENNFPEYALALRVDEKPIYLIRLSFDNEDFGTFLIQENENWVAPNLIVKAMALVGMETIADQGVIWQQSSLHEDLYEALSKIVEI